MEYILLKNLKADDKINKVWNKEYSAHDYESLDCASLHALLTRRKVVFI